MTRRQPLRILLGSTNPAKIGRLRACLTGWAFDLVAIDDLPPHDPPEEKGNTHADNAASKALGWARISGGLVIASDGGIDIPALGPNWNSVFTRRAAGEAANDEDRITHLLALTEHLESDTERQVVMREAVVIAAPSGVIRLWEADGLTAVLRRQPAETRIKGFWLACLLHIPRYNRPYTELTPEELQQATDPWATLATEIQAWLGAGGYERLRATRSK